MSNEFFLEGSIFILECFTGFIDFIVKPSFDLLKDMLDVVLPLPTATAEMPNISEDTHEDDEANKSKSQHKHVLWMETLTNNCQLNRDHWKSKCRQPGNMPMYYKTSNTTLTVCVFICRS